MSLRCDVCGKFAKHLNDVWCSLRENGIDHEACDLCMAKRGDGVR